MAKCKGTDTNQLLQSIVKWQLVLGLAEFEKIVSGLVKFGKEFLGLRTVSLYHFCPLDNISWVAEQVWVSVPSREQTATMSLHQTLCVDSDSDDFDYNCPIWRCFNLSSCWLLCQSVHACVCDGLPAMNCTPSLSMHVFVMVCLSLIAPLVCPCVCLRWSFCH